MKNPSKDNLKGKMPGEKGSLEKQRRIVRENSGFSPRTASNSDANDVLINDTLDKTEDIMFSTAEIIDFAEGSDSD